MVECIIYDALPSASFPLKWSAREGIFDVPRLCRESFRNDLSASSSIWESAFRMRAESSFDAEFRSSSKNFKEAC